MLPEKPKLWHVKHKLAVLKAIKEGHITDLEACKHYEISYDELSSWKKLQEQHGDKALKATKIKRYRNANQSNN